MDKTTETQQVKALTADALRFLTDLNHFAASVFGGPHTGLDDRDQFLLAHRWRMLKFSQGIGVTVRSGLIDPAGSLLRVLLELWYVIEAIADDPNKISDLFKQGQAENRKGLEALKKELAPNERDDLLTDDFLDVEIARLGTGTAFVAYNWAGMSKSKGSHATLYRLVSRHSHGGNKGTLDYFEGLDTDSPRLRPNIPLVYAPEYCLIAASLMIDSIKVLPLQTMTESRATELSKMEPILRALQDRNNILRATDVR